MDDWKLTAAARPVVKLERQSDMFVNWCRVLFIFTLDGAAQVAAAHNCLNERTLDPTVCSVDLCNFLYFSADPQYPLEY